MKEKQSIKRYVIRDEHGNIIDANGLSVVGNVEVHVAQEGLVGQPWAESAYQDGQLDIILHGIKGEGVVDIQTIPNYEEGQEDGGENIVSIFTDGREEPYTFPIRNGRRGNGITEIQVDDHSQEGDQAESSMTIRTTDGQNATLRVRNGKRGNGIDHITEQLSQSDGGTNTHVIHDTDGHQHTIHTINGRTGPQGETGIYDTNNPAYPLTQLKTTLGMSQTDIMTQKAVTEAFINNNVLGWEQIADYGITQSGTTGMSNNGNLIVSGDAFATQSTRNVFYFLAEENTVYKFEVAKANASSVKTIGLADDVPADGGSITEKLLTVTGAAFNVSVVAPRGGTYIFIALTRDSGTTVRVSKGITTADKIRNGHYLTADPQNLTDTEKSNARDNIGAAEKSEITELIRDSIVDWEKISYTGKTLAVSGNAFATDSNRNVYYFPIEQRAYYKFEVSNANSAVITIGFADEVPADGSAIAKKLEQFNGVTFTKYDMAENYQYMFIALQRNANFAISIYRGITLAESMRDSKYVTCGRQVLTDSEKQAARSNIGALSANIILDSVTEWNKIASYSSAGTSGMSNNGSLKVDGTAFATQSARNVFYFLAEENTAYKFEVTNANATSLKTIGIADETPAEGVGISQILATASTAAFTAYAVADRQAYIFLALQRDAGTTVNVYKGTTAFQQIRENSFVNTAPQTLTDSQKRQARENIGAGADDKAIRILYIGNSLTQDSVAYLPALLDEIAPNLDYKLYVWFNGASTLAEHYQRFLNGGTAGSFSVSSRNGAWTHYKDSRAVTIDQVLQTYRFDVLVLMEYFNGAAATDNSTPFSDVVAYIRSHYDKPFKVATLLHPPMRADTATYKSSVYNKTVNVNKLILKETEALSVIDVGAAMINAFDTELDALGKGGHLRYDPVHAQDGLPCLMQAYVHAIWIFRQLGLPYGIVNSQLRITQQVHDDINVPGPNSDEDYPPIEGTEEQHGIAQWCAVKADKIGRKLEMEALSEI